MIVGPERHLPASCLTDEAGNVLARVQQDAPQLFDVERSGLLAWAVDDRGARLMSLSSRYVLPGEVVKLPAIHWS